MAWSDAIAQIRTHLTTVGNAVTPTLNVRMSPVVQAPGRVLTCEYTGDTDNPQIGNTIGLVEIGEKIEIKAWVPFSSADQGAAEDLDVLLQNINRRITTLLHADANLGGYASGLRIDDATAAWEQLTIGPNTGQIFRTLTIPVVVGLPAGEPESL